jgi:hypothetical protein
MAALRNPPPHSLVSLYPSPTVSRHTCIFLTWKETAPLASSCPSGTPPSLSLSSLSLLFFSFYSNNRHVMYALPLSY